MRCRDTLPPCCSTPTAHPDTTSPAKSPSPEVGNANGPAWSCVATASHPARPAWSATCAAPPLLNFAVHYRGERGTHVLCETLTHTCCYAGSPMETRLRLLIESAGLPRPRVQWVVQDPVARTAVWIDLAWPQIWVGVEYEGEVHTDAASVRLDARRYTALVDKGWRMYRYTKDDILGAPERIVAELSRAWTQVR